MVGRALVGRFRLGSVMATGVLYTKKLSPMWLRIWVARLFLCVVAKWHSGTSHANVRSPVCLQMCPVKRSSCDVLYSQSGLLHLNRRSVWLRKCIVRLLLSAVEYPQSGSSHFKGARRSGYANESEGYFYVPLCIRTQVHRMLMAARRPVCLRICALSLFFLSNITAVKLFAIEWPLA